MFGFIIENVPEELKTKDLNTHMKLAPHWFSAYQELKPPALA